MYELIVLRTVIQPAGFNLQRVFHAFLKPMKGNTVRQVTIKAERQKRRIMCSLLSLISCSYLMELLGKSPISMAVAAATQA